MSRGVPLARDEARLARWSTGWLGACVNDSTNVGVVGFGMAGQIFHAPVIAAVPGLRLAAIVERHGSHAAEMFPQTRTVRSMEELLEDTSIALVVIATPNLSHFDLAKQALEAGRNVVVDKPFTVTSEQAKELIAVARSCSRLLSVFHNRRWDGASLTVAKVLASGLLGEVVGYEATFNRFRPELRPNAWREQNRPGSGVLYDLGSHLIDGAMALFGTPQAITAEIRSERPGASVDDAFDLRLHYARRTATLKASMLVAESGPSVAVHGTRGSYVKYGSDPQENALSRGQRPGTPGWGEEEQEHWGILCLPENGRMVRRPIPTEPGAYTGFYENIREAIRGTAPLSVTAEQGCRVVRAIELAQLSARSRRTVEWGDDR